MEWDRARQRGKFGDALFNIVIAMTGIALPIGFLSQLVGCNARIRSDSMGRVTVDPFNGFGREVVLTDIAHKFAFQIGDRGKDAAGDHVALDLGEPEFHLIQPGRVGRREMELDVRMRVQELAHLRGFVRREVVADDMDFFALGLARADIGEKSDELGAGVPRCGLTHDFAGLGVERRVQRQRSMAVVLKAMAFESAWRKQQNRIEPVERLDRSLLIDAEHGRMCRRIQIQPDYVGGLRLEIRIIGGHVALKPVRLNSVLRPNTRHHHVRDPERLTQLASVTGVKKLIQFE